MTLLALTAVICFGFAVYNLTCAFADIPTKRTSRMMLLAISKELRPTAPAVTQARAM